MTLLDHATPLLKVKFFAIIHKAIDALAIVT